MSDFLGRMAGRALGTLRVVKPVIRSTFTPERVEPETAIGFTIAAAAPERERTEENGPAHRQQAVPAEVQLSRPSELQPSPHALSEAQVKTIVPRPVLPVLEESRQIPPVKETQPEPLARRELSVMRNERPHDTLPIPVRESVPKRDAAEAPMYGPRREISAQPMETTESVIRVTIGRVDVRAEFPAAASARPAARRRQAPALSLDDYLRQRNEGKR